MDENVINRKTIYKKLKPEQQIAINKRKEFRKKEKMKHGK